ncbi:MAG: hypothetical protein ACKOE6_09715, partial [Flammeovirgaceae bacterium]
ITYAVQGLGSAYTMVDVHWNIVDVNGNSTFLGGGISISHFVPATVTYRIGVSIKPEYNIQGQWLCGPAQYFLEFVAGYNSSNQNCR